MNFRLITLILLGAITNQVVPAMTADRYPSGGRSRAMGGLSVTSQELWSVSNNQAGLAWLEGIRCGLFFENRFLLRELMYQQVDIAIPTRIGAFGLGVNYSGTSLYSELKTGFCYARTFGKQISAGLKINYLRVHLADDYGNTNLITCEVGLMFRGSNNFLAGFHVVNPVPIRLTTSPDEYLPTTICIGILYHFTGEFQAGVEVEKDLKNPLVIRAGAEYRPVKKFCLRGGISSNPWTISFGVGMEFGNVTMDLASSYHQILGFSPSGSLYYTFHKNQINRRN